MATSRATIIDVGAPFPSGTDAQAWLDRAGEDQLATDLAVLNRALHAFRVATADPYVNVVGRRQALVARVGYGAGEEVAEGLWTNARELAPESARRRRAAVLAPQARLAAVLNGRDRALACEELTLRARADAPAEYPPELSRLPPGRHGLPRDFVVHNQRERLIAGLAEAVAEKGYGGTTIADITRHAAVSRRTFYEHFDGKDECFVAAFDTVSEQLRERVDESFKAEDDWAHAARAGIGAMLTFLAAEPNLVRLAMVEALVAGPVVVERYDAAVQTFIPYFAAGREGRPKKVLKRLSDSTEEALVGGMVSLVSRRIVAGQAEELESLLPDLTEFTLAPYVGSDEAARVARDN